MPSFVTCPDAQEYERLRRGEMSLPEVEQLAQHVEKCGRCADQVQSLSIDDTLIESLRARSTVTDPKEQDRVSDLVARLKQFRLPANPAAEVTAAESPAVAALTPVDQTCELYDFLAPPRGPGEIGRLGPYRVLKVLGTGGMGVVFQAEDVKLKRLVALKAMRPATAASTGAGQRFQREAEATAAIKHDHIVTIYQVGEDRGVPFLAMEFLEGESLDDRLQSEGQLTIAEALRIASETAEGLAAAHEHGLIHRDIKPGNLWLEGKRGRVKVLDFGLARAAGDDMHLTQSGAIVGTPAYMAPEQARSEALDRRCDLFSLGSVLYRMVTGVLPFQGKDTMSMLLALAMEHPRPPRALNPQVPPALNNLILRLLAKNVADRPASAQAVVTALQAIERGPSQSTTAPPSMPPKTSRPSRLRRWLAVAAGLLLLLVPSVYFFAPTVLRIATNKGLLVIETEDAGVEVIVNGQAARIIDPHSKREVEVSAGDQEIVVKEMPDGLRFVTKKFTLTRGGKEVVRASFESAQGDKAAPPPKKETKIEGGEPLSALALVKRPARIEGVRSWSLETRRQRSVWLHCAVSADGQIAAAGEDGTIRVWDSAKGQMIRAFIPNTGQINGLSWSPDGKRLAAAGDGVVTQWEVATGRLVRTTQIPGGVSDVAWSPDGKYLAAGAGSGPRVWEVESEQIVELANSPGSMLLLAWSPDSRALACSSQGQKSAIWSIPSGKLVCTLTDKPLAAWLTALTWSPDGKTVVTGAYEGQEYQLWDPVSGKLLRTVKDPNPTDGRAAYSPDGKVLALSWGPGGYACINFYDAASGAALRSTGAWGQHSSLGLIWAPDGKSVTASFVNGRLVTIDFATGKARHDVLPHLRIDHVGVSPDGKRLAVWGFDLGLNGDCLHLWDLESGQRIGDVSLGWGVSVSWISFSPDGQTLAVSGSAGVKLYAAETGQLLRDCGDKPIAAFGQDRGPQVARPVCRSSSGWSQLSDLRSCVVQRGSSLAA